jgi:tRNA-Thr(GGU) m(6)t(6)A37 methyltransferase TsaA
MKTAYTFEPIGILNSCFDEKFGVARQSMLIPEARGVLKLFPNPKFQNAFNYLDGFSHLWIIYVFDRNIEKGWQSTVQPPRVDAPKNIGVFASRSPHRPNSIGMSVAKIERIDGNEIHVSGIDILNNTPVLDIKPYLPFADSHPQAISGWASAEIAKYSVSFSDESLQTINEAGTTYHPNFQQFLIQILELDPRPTSQKITHPLHDPKSEGHPFAFRLYNFDIKWKIQNAGIHVVELQRLQN